MSAAPLGDEPQASFDGLLAELGWPKAAREGLLELERKGFVELAVSDDGQAMFRPAGAAEFDGFPPGEVEEQARETLAVAWREALDNEPLPAQVEATALELLVNGGGRGVPGQFIAYDVDPREALAVALEAR